MKRQNVVGKGAAKPKAKAIINYSSTSDSGEESEPSVCGSFPPTPPYSSRKTKGASSQDKDADVSFMDTERLDESAYETQPASAEYGDADDGKVKEGEGPNEASGSGIAQVKVEKEGRNARPSVGCNLIGVKLISLVGYTSSEEVEEEVEYEEGTEGGEGYSGGANSQQETSDSSESEEDEDFPRPPPSIDIRNAQSHEVIRIYSDLIDSCRGFDNKVRSKKKETKLLMQNVSTGEQLFQQMQTSLSTTFGEGTPNSSANASGRSMLGNSASELHLACQHTKVCSSMLKTAAQNSGGPKGAFKLDEFLTCLKESSLDIDGNYSALSAVRKLAFTSVNASNKGTTFHTLSGCLDKDEVTRLVTPPPPPKPRLSRRSRVPETGDEAPTQMEVVNDGDLDDGCVKSNDTQERLAKDVLKTVKTKYAEKKVPPNLLEVAHGNNISDMLSRMMGAAFLARDGYVGITRDPNPKLEASTSLTLTPKTPPSKSGANQDAPQRQQVITSFNAGALKKFLAQQQQMQQLQQGDDPTA